jgi:hypothetical protein
LWIANRWIANPTVPQIDDLQLQKMSERVACPPRGTEFEVPANHHARVDADRFQGSGEAPVVHRPSSLDSLTDTFQNNACLLTLISCFYSYVSRALAIAILGTGKRKAPSALHTPHGFENTGSVLLFPCLVFVPTYGLPPSSDVRAMSLRHVLATINPRGYPAQ